MNYAYINGEGIIQRHVFDGHNDIEEHLPYLAQVVVDLDAKMILELGVRSGFSTRAFVEGARQTGATIISVDQDDCSNVCDYEKWIFIQLDDIALKIKGVFDIVFIDTAHSYTHTLFELQRFARLVRKGGKVILHDSNAQQEMDAIQDFLREKPPIFDFENRTNNNGLAILTRK